MNPWQTSPYTRALAERPCKLAEEFLSQKGIEFDSIDITTLDDAFGTLRAITGGQVATPTIVIGDEFHVGFDPAWMEARLAE